jgi:hypothetical protein
LQKFPDFAYKIITFTLTVCVPLAQLLVNAIITVNLPINIGLIAILILRGAIVILMVVLVNVAGEKGVRGSR